MEKKHLHEVGQIKAGAEVYIIQGTKVLMFKRSDDSPMFPGFWIGPGGHVDSDESLHTFSRARYKLYPIIGCYG